MSQSDPEADRPAEREHPLRALLVAQFAGAFLDNAWKLVLVVLAQRFVEQEFGPAGQDHDAAIQSFTTKATVWFTVPLILFSFPAATLADRVSKRTVILFMKAAEVALMAAGAISLWNDPTDMTTPLVLLGILGAQSALFSPAKYGILPEIVPHSGLSAANGAIESWTFAAIIGGTVAGPFVLGMSGDAPWIAGAVLTVVAAIGFCVAFGVPKVPRARADGSMWTDVAAGWRAIRGDRTIWLAVMGLVAFWTLASAVGQDLLVYAKVHLKLAEEYRGLPLAAFGVGIGLGSVLAARMSGDKVETGLIPLGAIGISVAVSLVGLFMPGLFWTVVLLGASGVASGLVLVPLNSILQWRAPVDRKGAVIAVANVFMFGGVAVGSFGVGALAQQGVNVQGILIASGLGLLAGTVWALRLLPEAFVRLVLVILTHTLYRVKVVGRENVRGQGGVLLAPNHVSFVDWAFILASLDRPVRFLVDEPAFEQPFTGWLLRLGGAIPISSKGSPKEILRALRDAGEYLDENQVVCIFPEGQLTRTGAMQPFRRGVEKIAKGRDAELVPVHLDRVWGSIFSYSGGKFVWKWPSRIPYPITVSFGTPLPPGTKAPAIRSGIRELAVSAWAERKADRWPLHRSFIRGARRSRSELMFADATRKVSRLEAVAGAIALGRKLRPHWKGQERVGILLPPSVAGALVNIAASMGGRTSVNLNYTAGRAGMESAARQAELRTVVTSRKFIEKAELELPGGVEPIWLEDVGASIAKGDKTTAGLMALFAPMGSIERACGAMRRIDVDDVATIIFSSGSTGEPKGIELTHFNIDSNVEAVAQVARLEEEDRLLGILPLFHSFGTMALWLSANHGMSTAFHPNPLDAAAVGELVEEHSVTLLLATPTFLQIYLRRCTPAQFGSLRIVLAGAERLPDRLWDAYDDRFGIRLLEGYGTTECSPVVATGVPDFRAPGFFQPGAKRGFVGQPLPGIAVRVEDPDTGEEMPVGKSGLLLVRGPNVMKGYLGRPDLTAKVLRDGWYVTGDIALIDDDGFLKITDRQSRFSKIGGEMVPHGRVEDALHEAIDERDQQVFAVTGLPDERKGERLAVLYTRDIDLHAVLDRLGQAGLPNLFIPRKDQFVRVDAIPVLGTGKTDLRAVKDMAAAALVASDGS